MDKSGSTFKDFRKVKKTKTKKSFLAKRNLEGEKLESTILYTYLFPEFLKLSELQYTMKSNNSPIKKNS